MILLVCAMMDEAKELTKNLKEVTSTPFEVYEGRISDKAVKLIISGVGKTNASSATAYMLSKHKFDLIINFGLAGGHNLKLANSYLINQTTYHDFDLTFFKYQKGQVPKFPTWFESNKLKGLKSYLTANVYTGDYFSVKPLVDTPYLADMESAAIYQVAYRFKTPIIGLKIVSDLIGSSNQESDYKASETNFQSLLADGVKQLLTEV